jgi:hypothetical protein
MDYEYTCTASTATEFPFHPVQAVLQPGETVVLVAPVDHAHLEPSNDAAKKAARERAKKEAEAPSSPRRGPRRSRKPKTTRAAGDAASTPKTQEPAAEPATKE